MRKITTAGLIGLLMIVSYAVGRRHRAETATESARLRRILYWVDPMHPDYKSDRPGTAPDCGMALEPVYEGDNPTAKLQLPAGAVSIAPEKQQLIGVRTEVVEKNSGSRLVRTTGRVAPDDNRVYRMMAGTDGWIQSLQASPAGTVV